MEAWTEGLVVGLADRGDSVRVAQGLVETQEVGIWSRSPPHLPSFTATYISLPILS